MKYLELAYATERVKALVGISDPNDTKIEDVTFIEELLEMTLGKHSTELHYRVFLSAAMFLLRDLDTQAIKEADDVVFTNQLVPIKALLSLQNGYDLSNQLEVPEGFGVYDILSTVEGLNSNIPVTSIMTV
jgi:hypothetical protein